METKSEIAVALGMGGIRASFTRKQLEEQGEMKSEG